MSPTDHPDWGVIAWPGAPAPVCYQIRWDDELGPVLEARVLGSESLLELTDELRAAITADRQRVK